MKVRCERCGKRIETKPAATICHECESELSQEQQMIEMDKAEAILEAQAKEDARKQAEKETANSRDEMAVWIKVLNEGDSK
jgi:hypothetical protein